MPNKTHTKVSSGVKSSIKSISGMQDTTMQKTGGLLAELGNNIKEAGGDVEIRGPFGVPRPFSEVSLGDFNIDMVIEIDEEEVERSMRLFGQSSSSANLRRSMRLGFLYLASTESYLDTPKIEGPGFVTRIFSEADIEGISSDIENPFHREF